MHERKAAMAELADAFVALPGAAGTLEELFEAWTWGMLGLHAKPTLLLDVDDFWQPLLTQLHRMVDDGYLDGRRLDALGRGAHRRRPAGVRRPGTSTRRTEVVPPGPGADSTTYRRSGGDLGRRRGRGRAGRGGRGAGRPAGTGRRCWCSTGPTSPGTRCAATASPPRRWTCWPRLGVDVDAVTDGYPAVPRLRLTSPSGRTVERAMHRPAVVVPRAVLDGRVLDAALAAGAELRRHTVRRVDRRTRTAWTSTACVTAGVLIGADGAESVVRRALGIGAEPRRTGWRSPSAGTRRAAGPAGVQVITTTEQRWPAYAWSFPIGDGRANVGYGELVSGGATRAGLLEGLHRLLPGVEPTGLRAHRLPLSTGRPRQPDGRVLLAGDAQSLINPMTGEGIFYAVLSGALAGAAAAHGAGAGRGASGTALQRRLGRHLRHTVDGLPAQQPVPWLMDAAFGAAAADQRVFDDVVALGLADGRLTGRAVRGAVRSLALR